MSQCPHTMSSILENKYYICKMETKNTIDSSVGLESINSDIVQKLVEMLRNISTQTLIQEKQLTIPDGCEKNGFVQGQYKLGDVLHFLADMIEE